MEAKLEMAKQVLQKYGQEHILNFFNELSKEKQNELLNQILTMDFKELEKLYESTKTKPDFENSKIEPIAHIVKEELTKEEKQEYAKIGEEIIKQGKLAVVTMAGGQGTRLGHSGPKGTYDIGLSSHKPIFEILCDTLKIAREKYQIDIPWYLMTSEENHEDTVNFFEQNQYFGYPKTAVTFFKQGMLPMLDANRKSIIK